MKKQRAKDSQNNFEGEEGIDKQINGAEQRIQKKKIHMHMETLYSTERALQISG